MCISPASSGWLTCFGVIETPTSGLVILTSRTPTQCFDSRTYFVRGDYVALSFYGVCYGRLEMYTAGDCRCTLIN